MNNTKDNIIQEQTDENLEREKRLNFELGMQMASLGPIPKTKMQSAAVIKRIFDSSKQRFYAVGEPIDLEADLKKLKDKIRFMEYGKSFHEEKEGRGFNFEGMLAGLFKGAEVVIGKNKEDIIVGGIPYSVKSAEGDNPSFDSGTLIPGLLFVKETIGLEFEKNKRSRQLTPDSQKRWEEEYSGITTPWSLLNEEGEEWDVYKEMMLDFSFRSGNGDSLEWIFAKIEPNIIKYTVWSSAKLIAAIINDGDDIVGVGRNPNTDIRLKSSYLFTHGKSSTITFPVFTSDQLNRLRYNPDRGLKIDKIAELFGKYRGKVRRDVLQYIQHNPKAFLNRVVDLYGGKLGPMLKEKGFVELNESIDYNDPKVQNLIIEVLLDDRTIINEIDRPESYSVITPKLWSVIKLAYEISQYRDLKSGRDNNRFNQTLKEFFYISDYTQTSILWLIIEYNAKKYDISPSEVVKLPIEKVKIPDKLYQTEYYYNGSYETMHEEEECDDGYGVSSGEDCDCEKYEDIEVYDKEYEAYDEVPCDEAPHEDRKKAGYNDEYDCPCEEWEHKDYEIYYYPTLYANTFSLTLPERLDDFNELDDDDTVIIERDDTYDYGEEEAETWEYFNDDEEGYITDQDSNEEDIGWYLEQLNFKLYNIKESLTEDSDIFGQGLLDPIDPEEFEGDEEEWEELVSDVDDDEFEVEPEYEYTGGKTDPEKGFVAPSAEVTDNICRVKGFCTEQGPITFGQLKALVEEATKKRIRADMGRGVFKTLWRVIPFFIPQVLLASVGITVTRAINKIITPALKDTGGYKSWWGKAVLKAMDVAEGDYIPDIALGDDPLSKIFFISDGLLQMIRDKYKLKFARYVAEVASVMGDDRPVPEWFVENLLRDYLNQKFLLDPPLSMKKGVTTLKEENKYEPDYSIRRGRQHYAMNVKDSPTESITALNKYLIEKSPFNYMGFDYYLSAVPYDISSTARIDVFAPMLDTGKNSDELWSGREVTYYEDINIDDAFSHDEWHGTDYADDPYIKQTQPLHAIGYNHKFGEHYSYGDFIDNHPEQSEFTSGDFINEPGVAYEFSWGKRFNNLKDDMEKLKKLFSLDGIVINRDTSRPWMRHPDSYGNENIRPGKTVPRVLDMKEHTEVETVPPKPEYEPFTKLEVTILNYLVKQFTKEELQLISSTDWSQISSELAQKYGNYLKYFGMEVNDGDEEWAKGTRFAKWITDNWTDAEYYVGAEGDSPLDFGKVTNPIKDWPNLYSVTGTESGWEQVYRSGSIEIPAYDEDDAFDRAEEAWYEYDPDMETDDYGDYESDDFNIDDSSIEFYQSLKEHIMSLDDDEHRKIDLEKFGNLLVKAIFSKEGGWGRAPQMFILYMTPSGIIKAIKHNSSTTQSSVPFKEEEKVDLASLIRFEKESGFDLRMKGRLRESIKTKRINESIKKWVNSDYDMSLDHNNLPIFINNKTNKKNTYNDINNLVCEIWGKQYDYKLDVNDFEVKDVSINRLISENRLFEGLNNKGVDIPTDTLTHYLNKNLKEEIKDNILKDKNINLNKLHEKLVKLGFIKENQPTQKIVLEWLDTVAKEINQNAMINENGEIYYTDNIIEASETVTPHGIGVPTEIFWNISNELKPAVLKEVKPYVNEFMYYCLGFEEMKPEDSEDWYSIGYQEGFDVLIHHAEHSPFATVEDILSDSCSDSYASIREVIRELERKLINMGVLEQRVNMSKDGKLTVLWEEDNLPESLVELYTQIYSEIDERLKSTIFGMPMVNKEVQKVGLTESYQNPLIKDLKIGDSIRLVYMDDPQGIPIGTYGKIEGFDSDPWEERILVKWYVATGETRNLSLYPSIDTFMMDMRPNQIKEPESNTLKEQGEQLTLFPTGKWEFTAHEDVNDAKWLEKTVSDDVIKILFKKWDEEGINLKIFKYLGIPPSGLVLAYIVKRYLQNTNTPVSVSYTFDCAELAELFDTHSNEYDFDYIKEYLCGDYKFWDHEDWYNYEWENSMTDSIDENNWKTIMGIFGVDSQEVAENILIEQPQNEEEEELLEKHQEDVDEIQNYIVWANNDETEYATKSAMARDIDNELAQHFQGEGRLLTDDNGRKSWRIEGDLRDYVNDQWDNTETFEFHEDHLNTVLEDVIMDLGVDYFKADTLFGYLMEEEYMFGEYCEGKQGDCLQPETKFFDGYWYPEIDINHSLSDRLGELTYNPEEVGEPLQENRNVPHWDLYQLLTRTSNIDNNRRRKVFDFLNVLQNVGLVNMYQSPDFLWSGSKWLTKYLDLHHPELLEEPDEDIEKGDEGYWDNDKIKQTRYLLDNADSVRDTVLMMLIDKVDDPESIKVESQMRPFAIDLVKLWVGTK